MRMHGLSNSPMHILDEYGWQHAAAAAATTTTKTTAAAARTV